MCLERDRPATLFLTAAMVAGNVAGQTSEFGAIHDDPAAAKLAAADDFAFLLHCDLSTHGTNQLGTHASRADGFLNISFCWDVAFCHRAGLIERN